METRRWKQIYHCLELSFIAIIGAIIIGVILVYSDGRHLQTVLMFFTLLHSLASLALAPVMLRPFFKRWQIFALTLGLGCGMGLSALAAIFSLQLLQLAS